MRTVRDTAQKTKVKEPVKNAQMQGVPTEGGRVVLVRVRRRPNEGGQRSRWAFFTGSTRGNVTIMMAIVLPTMVALLALVVNVGLFLHARAKLQIAADRGVFAGAASLAHSLNSIAEDNWKLNHEFKDLEAWLASTSERTEEEIEKRIRETRARQVAIMDEITAINAAMFARATSTAQSVAEANVPGAAFTPFFEPPADGMMRIGTSEEEGAHYGELSGAAIVGCTFDPNAYTIPEAKKILRYLEKEPRADVLFGGWARALSPAPIFAPLFGAPVAMRAAAAAEPYGGSLARFAEVEGEGDDPPLAVGREQLYRVGFVPIRAVTDEEPYALH